MRRYYSLVKAACEVTGADIDDFSSKKKHGSVALARQLVAWELRKAGVTYEKIGEVIGRGHATAIHAVKTIQKYIDINDRMMIGLILDFGDQLDSLYLSTPFTKTY